MAMDTPARIAIIGAGPIGLEAALYGRFLGYDVDLYEQGDVAANVQRWGHVRMFSPFGQASSTLGRAALTAQDPEQPLPALDAFLTGEQYYRQYLLRLAESDLIVDGLQTGTEVLAASRPDALKTERPGDPQRGEAGFRLLLRTREGTERTARCDILIDASGVYDRPLWMGPGGAPALGESRRASQIRYHLPDLLGTDRLEYQGRHTLLVGSSYSAATAVCDLAALANEHPQTRITWITHLAMSKQKGAPLERFDDDPLVERDALAQRANSLALEPETPVDFRPASTVQEVHLRANSASHLSDPTAAAGEIEVILQEQASDSLTTLTCDRILALVGYRGRSEFLSELQVQRCYATEAPVKLAASLSKEPVPACFPQTGHGVDTLRHPEPHFYTLGAKSYGRNSSFLISVGCEQIRELFARIGDRADLNLYAGARKLPS